jgi:hypothetical protein
MSTGWYIQKSGKVFGPHTSAKLKEGALSGMLSPDDLIRKGEEGNWMRASKAKGLFGTEPVPEIKQHVPSLPQKPVPVQKPLDSKQKTRALLRFEKAHLKVAQSQQRRRTAYIWNVVIGLVLALITVPVACGAGWLALELSYQSDERMSESDKAKIDKAKKYLRDNRNAFKSKTDFEKPNRQQAQKVVDAGRKKQSQSSDNRWFHAYMAGTLSSLLWICIAIYIMIQIASRLNRRARLSFQLAQQDLSTYVEEIQRADPEWVASSGGAAALLDYEQFQDELRLSDATGENLGDDGTPLLQRTAGGFQRPRTALTWEILAFVGAIGLFLAVWFQWWSVHFYVSLKDQGDLKRFSAMLKKHNRFHEDIGIDQEIASKFESLSPTDTYASFSSRLSGWSFGAGVTGFIFSIILIIALPLMVFVKPLKPWAWTISSAGAVCGLISFILILVFLMTVPTSYSPLTQRIGDFAPIWLSLLGSILVFGALLTHAILSFLAFLKWRRNLAKAL